MFTSGKWATMRAMLIGAVALSAFGGPTAGALPVAFCGDGLVEPELGEVCDDGDPATGVCCSSCQIAVAGTPCSGATLCSANGVCDGASSDISSCVAAAAPRAGCRHALKSMLVLKRSDDTRGKLVWKWINGDQTSLEDFGMPTGTTSYALCVFAGPTNTAIRQIQTQYDSFSFWSAISTRGYDYWYSGDKVILRAGDQGEAKALMRVSGPNPTLKLPLPVTAQLINSANDICFESVYDTADVIRNDALRFKAKAQ